MSTHRTDLHNLLSSKFRSREDFSPASLTEYKGKLYFTIWSLFSDSLTLQSISVYRLLMTILRIQQVYIMWSLLLRAVLTTFQFNAGLSNIPLNKKSGNQSKNSNCYLQELLTHTSILPTSATKPHTWQQRAGSAQQALPSRLCPVGAHGHQHTLSPGLPVLVSHLPVLTFWVVWILYVPLSPSGWDPGWQSGQPTEDGGYLHMHIQPLAPQTTLDFLQYNGTGQEVATKNLVLAVRLFS